MPKYHAPINRTRRQMKCYSWMIVADFGGNLHEYFISAPTPPDHFSVRKEFGIPEQAEILVGAP